MNHDDDTAASEPSEDVPVRKIVHGRRWPHKLTEEQRDYVTRRLARYDTPMQIVRDMREQFGIQISRQGVEHYDPTRVPDCPKRAADLFFAERKPLVGSRFGRTVKHGKLERMMYGALEMLLDRILKGVDAEGRRMFVKRPEDITDDDRLSVMLAFVDKLKESNPAGYAKIRQAVSGTDEKGDGNRAAAPQATPDSAGAAANDD